MISGKKYTKELKIKMLAINLQDRGELVEEIATFARGLIDFDVLVLGFYNVVNIFLFITKNA